MKETILVTGGAGFIGSHIVDALVAAGYEAVVVDNLHTGKRANLNPAARFYEVDIRDARALEAVFADERPATVVHQAALADVRGSVEDPVGYAAVNILGSLNLLEAARHYGARRFIFASTGGAVYGQQKRLPATEASPAHPLDPYGASKLAVEHYLYLYRENFGIEYCALRYPNVYGPRQDPQGEAGVVAIFAGKMLSRQPVIINGDGCQVRDFVYVGDIARANLLAVGHGRGIYNLGSSIGTDVNTIFCQLAGLTAYQGPEIHVQPKLGEVRSITIDPSRARRALGWEPQVPLSEGLARTIAYFRAALGEAVPVRMATGAARQVVG
jgi:UDP-glucose 4-epimerase